MNFLNKIDRLIYRKSEITHSENIATFTKYGKFQMKAYKDDHQEYIAIMSQDFFELNRPVVYIHFDVQHSEMDHDMHCYCVNQVKLALKMIKKSGGLIVYASHEGVNIDNLLKDIKTRRLDENNQVKNNSRIKFDIKEKIAYLSLAFILKDLKVSSVKLITNDAKVIDIVQLLDIDILKIEANIAFEYGNNKISL